MTTPEKLARECAEKIWNDPGRTFAEYHADILAALAAATEAQKDALAIANTTAAHLHSVIKNRDGEIAMLRELANGYTVPQADYDRLYKAAFWLRRSCKDRLPPGQYDKLSEECGDVDDALHPEEART